MAAILPNTDLASTCRFWETRPIPTFAVPKYAGGQSNRVRLVLISASSIRPRITHYPKFVLSAQGTSNFTSLHSRTAVGNSLSALFQTLVARIRLPTGMVCRPHSRLESMYYSVRVSSSLDLILPVWIQFSPIPTLYRNPRPLGPRP